jgi:hypothetical protein
MRIIHKNSACAIKTYSQFAMRPEDEIFMKRFAILAVIFVLFLQPLCAIDLPKPPLGFTWQEIPEIKAAFLKPNGWFFRHETQKGTEAYFITKEDIGIAGQFQTGLTVNVMHFKKDSAVDHAKALVDNIAGPRHGTTMSRTVGPFQEFSCEVSDTDSTGTIRQHVLTIANPKTNAMYLFIFESPLADWDSAWKSGEQIMDTLAIDDEI